jgi:coenzyme Q-binding protein COQ10
MPIAISRSFAQRETLSWGCRPMPSAHLVRRIRHRPEDLFDLVSDVENYPKFINLISALRVTKQLSETEFEAEAIVAYKMLRETFRSKIVADPVAGKISVEKAEKGGAVKSLLNTWTFHPLEDGSTLVDVIVDVRLKAMPLEFLLRDKFGKAAVHIMNLFEVRAGQNYPLVGNETYDSVAEMTSFGLRSDQLV